MDIWERPCRQRLNRIIPRIRNFLFAGLPGLNE
jgi:hypothetical protein